MRLRAAWAAEELVVCGVEWNQVKGVSGRWAKEVYLRRSWAAWAAEEEEADVVRAVGWRTKHLLARALEDDAAWAVTAVAKTTTSAAGERCCAGVWPGPSAMDRRVEALAVVLLAERLAEDRSQYSFESLLRRGVIHVPL